MVKNLPAVQETRVQLPGWEDPWRRKWQPTPVFLPGKSHGQRTLAGYSQWGCKESDKLSHQTTSTELVSVQCTACLFSNVLFIYMAAQALVAAHRIFSLCCGMQDF